MEIQLWSLGKESKDYLDKGTRLYTKRIQHYSTFSLKIISGGKASGKLSSKELKKQEAEKILNLLKPRHQLILLDEAGKNISSKGLAQLIQQEQIKATKTLVFLIGGAFGVADPIFKRAHRVISLSELTFPHQLVRLLMAEQIYRAFTILHGESYHHV